MVNTNFTGLLDFASTTASCVEKNALRGMDAMIGRLKEICPIAVAARTSPVPVVPGKGTTISVFKKHPGMRGARLILLKFLLIPTSKVAPTPAGKPQPSTLKFAFPEEGASFVNRLVRLLAELTQDRPNTVTFF